MSRENEEFGGFLGWYLEGVKQAHYPLFNENEQKRAKEKKEMHTVSARKVNAETCSECCGSMTPALCSKN